MTSIDVAVPELAIPGQHGVYVAFDAHGDVLYIGRTKNLMRRMASHRSSAAWFRQMRTLEFTPCDGLNETRVLEKALIAQFRPDANINDHAPQQRSTRQTLPAWTVAKLVQMHEECAAAIPHADAENERLNNYILALRQAGWTLAAIGEALSVTREAVRLRAGRARKADGSVGIPAPPVKAKRQKKVWPSIPPETVSVMLALQADARRVNGPTPLDSPLRVASERYTEMLAEQHMAGISIYRIAKQMGVTHLAIRARLARHGYMGEIKGLPANIKYGTPWVAGGGKSDECKAGHKLAGDNLHLINGDPKRRSCRACSRRRSQEYSERKRNEQVAS